MLAPRLAKRMKHVAKWARRQDVHCFRVYERDIPDYPIVVDWYADPDSGVGMAVAWLHDRTRDDSDEKVQAYRRDARAQILDGLGLDETRLFVKHRGRQRAADGGREQYERVDDRSVTLLTAEHGSRFEVNLSDYVDVGLFLDHRPSRLAVRQRAAGKRVLNLFAYTGAFTVHARAGDAAKTTTVDMSRTYLEWFERNLAHNGFTQDDEHVTVHADCLQWLEDGPSDGEAYDIVICDPPTFSNSARMKADSFAIERDYVDLLRSVARFVAPGGEVFFSTNARRFDLDPANVPAGYGVQEITHRSIPEDVRNKKIHRCWRLAEGWTRR